MSAEREAVAAAADEEAVAAREAERRAIAEHNALADVFDAVRAASAEGVLSTPAHWVEQGLVPEHLSAEDLEMMAYDHLMGWYEGHGRPDEGGSFLASDPLAPPQPTAPKGPSPFACRGVGVPPAIGGAGAAGEPGQLGQEAAGDEGEAAEGAKGPSPFVDAGPSPLGAQAGAAGVAAEGAACADGAADDAAGPSGFELVEVEGELALVEPGLADEGPFAGLRVPEGYELMELEGEIVLMQVDPDALPQRRPIRCESVALLMGAYGYYLYDTSLMTGAYARWAFLAAEDDPLVTFVYCVREESRVYPRPMAITSFANEPFTMGAALVEELFEQAQSCPDYADVRRTEASNGDVYFYSTDHLTPTQADALAEWHSVERLRNM